MLVISEIFGHRERRQPYTKSSTRRFVHLSEHHHHMREDTGVLHVVVKFLAFPTTFSNPAKQTYSLVVADHVVDHFGKQHRLTHSSPSEEPRFTTSFQWYQQINRFDSRFKNFGLRGTTGEWWWVAMDGSPFHVRGCGLTIDDVAEHIEHA